MIAWHVMYLTVASMIPPSSFARVSECRVSECRCVRMSCVGHDDENLLSISLASFSTDCELFSGFLPSLCL